MGTELSKEAKAYLDELAAEIVASGARASEENIMQLAAQAHEKRQAFAAEMAAQQTPRSKMAAKAIATDLWIRGQNQLTARGFIFDCDRIASSH